FPSIVNVERIARALEVTPYRLYMTERDLEKLLLEGRMPGLSKVRREALARDVAEILDRYAGENMADPRGQ
ncbi:MAG TPA: hypothetical protein VLH39_04695, partial [Magnetospirillaceae bacterium]|nr:hypothetical protein [Magnetospirillaceae bacterium]